MHEHGIGHGVREIYVFGGSVPVADGITSHRTFIPGTSCGIMTVPGNDGVSRFVETGSHSRPFPKHILTSASPSSDFGFSVRFDPDGRKPLGLNPSIVLPMSCSTRTTPHRRKVRHIRLRRLNLGRVLEHELEEATNVGRLASDSRSLSQIYVITVSDGKPRGNSVFLRLHRTLESHDKPRAFEAPDITQRTGIRVCHH